MINRRRRMMELVRKYIAATFLFAVLLSPMLASAASVWSAGYFDSYGAEYNLHIVSSLNHSIDSTHVTGIYLDSTTFDILDPNDLLYASPESVLSSTLDTYDYASNSIFILGIDTISSPNTTLTQIDTYLSNISHGGGALQFYNNINYPDYITMNPNVYAVTHPIHGLLIDNVIQHNNSSIFTMTATSAVPLPAAVWLFGSGLFGLIAVARRKKA
jgi:hypothetical protein